MEAGWGGKDDTRRKSLGRSRRSQSRQRCFLRWWGSAIADRV